MLELFPVNIDFVCYP